MSRVRRGEVITFSSVLTEGARGALPSFLITRYGGGYWLFHGFDNLLLRTTVATHGEWRVWPRRWWAKEVARYWSDKKELWLPLIDYCESSRVMANLYVGNGLALEWVAFPYRFRGLKWDSVPPTNEVLRRFEQFCALLEQDAIGC